MKDIQNKISTRFRSGLKALHDVNDAQLDCESGLGGSGMRFSPFLYSSATYFPVNIIKLDIMKVVFISRLHKNRC